LTANRSIYEEYGVFRSDAIPEEQKADVKYHVDMIEQMDISTEAKFICYIKALN
jgi:hypothetical protein